MCVCAWMCVCVYRIGDKRLCIHIEACRDSSLGTSSDMGTRMLQGL